MGQGRNTHTYCCTPCRYGDTILPDIQATLADDPKTGNTVRPMMRGATIAHFIFAPIYFVLGIMGESSRAAVPSGLWKAAAASWRGPLLRLSVLADMGRCSLSLFSQRVAGFWAFGILVPATLVSPGVSPRWLQAWAGAAACLQLLFTSQVRRQRAGARVERPALPSRRAPGTSLLAPEAVPGPSQGSQLWHCQWPGWQRRPPSPRRAPAGLAPRLLPVCALRPSPRALVPGLWEHGVRGDRD
jgi:hypothetical protein